MAEKFRLVAPFKPKGDQPEAIRDLCEGIRAGKANQTLLGVTGSGKTFTAASVISELNRPALIISPNKVLAAQLYSEFKTFFPDNAVEYFVSYYDYYQPEAYIPSSDTYIEKDASINDHIDKLRLKATSSILSRRDTIVVASVSCIYNIGSPDSFSKLCLHLRRGDAYDRRALIGRLVAIQYERNETEFARGTFRMRGGTIDIFPADMETAYRVELGDRLESIREIHPLTGDVIKEHQEIIIYPATHFVAEPAEIARALSAIEAELADRLKELNAAGKLLEAQRIEQRTRYDLEMIRQTGYCHGIENYSRHLIIFRRISCFLWTNRTSARRRYGACTRATAPGNRRWWTSGSGCRRPWTTARSCSVSSRRCAPLPFLFRRRRGLTRPRSAAGKIRWSRSSGPPAWWTRR
jgi:excinuclease ABC subunit B